MYCQVCRKPKCSEPDVCEAVAVKQEQNQVPIGYPHLSCCDERERLRADVLKLRKKMGAK